MDERGAKMLMNMFMAMQGQGLPSYNTGFSNSLWGDTRMFGMTPEPDSFFGPIGNIVAGFIPGMTVPGIDGRQTPVFKTNFRAQNSGMTGLQNLYMKQNAATYGATAQNATMGMQGNAAKLGSGIGKILTQMGAPPEVGTALTGLLGSELGAGAMQSLANNLMGYDMGASVAVANQMSPYMAASHIRNSRMKNMVAPEHRDVGLHPMLNGEAASGILRPDRGTYNVMDMYNPFDDNTTKTRIAMSKMAQQTSDKLTWDGIYKKDGVHGATSAYVTEIVGRALAEGTDGMNLGLGTKGKLDLDKSIEKQKGMQAALDDIYNRKGDPDKGEKRGVVQLQTLLAEANKRGDKDAAMVLEHELRSVMEDEVKPATDALAKVSEDVAKGMGPFVESVTGVTASLKDFYGTEQESKAALDRLTGGQGFKDKAAADRLRDQITEVKMLGAMAGLSPQMTGQLFQAHEKISGGIGGSNLGRSGGTGAEAAAWTADLLKGLIGANVKPGQEEEYIKAHAAGHEAWNNSTGKKALTALTFAKEKGLFTGNDTDYAEIQRLMTSGSRKDLDTAMAMLGEKWTGSKEELMQMIRDPHQMAFMFGKLSQEGKDQVNRSGVLARDREFRKMDADSRYKVAQRQEERQLRASGISSKEIRQAKGESDFDSMREFLSTVSPDAAAILDREYQAAMEGKNPNDPNAVREAKARAKAQFYRTGGADYLNEEQQKEMKNKMMQDRTHTLKRMNGFEGREGGTISSSKGGFFDRVGATDSHGLTRSAMEGATKDMLSQLTRMGKSAGTKDGRDIRSAMRDFKKQRAALMKAGKYDEAEQLTQDFWNNLDDQTQQRIEMSGKKHSYATVDNMAQREKANQARQDIAAMAENAKKMGDLGSTENAYRLQELQNAAIHEADPEKKAAMLKEIKNLEDKAEKDSRSDLETAVKEAQEGNFEKLALALKNANVTAEQFYETLMKFASGGGATTTTAAEAAAAAKAGEASEGRNAFLDSTVAVSDRLEMMGSDDDVRSYIGALAGTSDVKDEHVKWYKKQMQKAAGGDKKSYLDILEGEGEFLDYSKGNLEKQRDEASKIAGSASVEDIQKELEGTTDEKKKAKLNEKLSAAQRRDRYDVTIAKLGAKKERIDRESKAVDRMSDVEFKEKMSQSAELARAPGQGAAIGSLNQAGTGGAGGANIPQLLATLQRVATLLEQNPAIRGSNVE